MSGPRRPGGGGERPAWRGCPVHGPARGGRRRGRERRGIVASRSRCWRRRRRAPTIVHPRPGEGRGEAAAVLVRPSGPGIPPGSARYRSDDRRHTAGRRRATRIAIGSPRVHSGHAAAASPSRAAYPATVARPVAKLTGRGGASRTWPAGEGPSAPLAKPGQGDFLARASCRTGPVAEQGRGRDQHHLGGGTDDRAQGARHGLRPPNRLCRRAGRHHTVRRVEAEHDHPALARFLALLAADIEVRPEALRALTPELADRLRGLAEGVPVDLDAPIGDGVDL